MATQEGLIRNAVRTAIDQVMNKKDRLTLALILTAAFSLIALAPLPMRSCSPPQPCSTGPAFPLATFPPIFTTGVALLLLAAIFYFRKRSKSYPIQKNQ
jgi:hypothetical protein